MQGELAIIRRIIDEHQSIREHMKLVGDSVSDQEALATLRETHADLIPGRSDVLSERYKRVQQSISYLDDGLKNHFAFEEQALPAFLGELLIRGLVLEHLEISKEIDKARAVIAETEAEGLSREQLLSKDADMQQLVDNIRHSVEEHALKEEAILEMIERALEEKRM